MQIVEQRLVSGKSVVFQTLTQESSLHCAMPLAAPNIRTSLLMKMNSRTVYPLKRPQHLSNRGMSVLNTQKQQSRNIPTFNWTTVHSVPRSRAHSVTKSFSATWQSIAAVPHRVAPSHENVVTAGLFDPTLKSDELEADERRRLLQQRRRLRGHKEHAVPLYLAESSALRYAQSHHTTMLQDGQSIQNKQGPEFQQQRKCEASLTELQLTDPTLLKTLVREERNPGNSGAFGDSFICDISAEALPYEFQGLQHVQQQQGEQRCLPQKTVFPYQRKLMEKHQWRLRMPHKHKKQPRFGQHMDTARQGYSAFRVTNSDVVNSHQRCRAVKQSVGRPLPLSKMRRPSTSLNQMDFSVVALDGSSIYQPSGLENWSTTLPDCGCLQCLYCTRQRVKMLQKKLAAYDLPSLVNTSVNAQRQSEAARAQQFLEGLLAELAQALRNGPPGRTTEGAACLLAFLHQQQGFPLRAKKVRQLLKLVQHSLSQAVQSGTLSRRRHLQYKSPQSAVALQRCNCVFWKRQCSSFYPKAENDRFSLENKNDQRQPKPSSVISDRAEGAVITEPSPPSSRLLLINHLQQLVNREQLHHTDSLQTDTEKGFQPVKALQERRMPREQLCNPIGKHQQKQLQMHKRDRLLLYRRPLIVDYPADSGLTSGVETVLRAVPINIVQPTTAEQASTSHLHKASSKHPGPNSITPTHGRQQPGVQRCADLVAAPHWSSVKSQSMQSEERQMHSQVQPLPQKALDAPTPRHIISCLLRVQEAECRAAETLQSIGQHASASFHRQKIAVTIRMPHQSGNKLYCENMPDSKPVNYQCHQGHSEEAECFFVDKHLTAALSSQRKQREIPLDATQRIMAFCSLRKNLHITKEPLLHQNGTQQALHQLQQNAGANYGLDDGIAGLWTLQTAIAEQLLQREVKKMVCLMNTVINAFVDRLLKTEIARMTRCLLPLWQNHARLGSDSFPK